jgi:hypothetical protein
LAVIPLEDNEIDPDFKDDVCTWVEAYVGDEAVDINDLEIIDSELINVDGNKVTAVLSKLNPDITTIPIQVKLKGNTTLYTVT